MNWFLQWSREQLNSNNQMTERDFKLLVREYFQAKSRAEYIKEERLKSKNLYLSRDLEKKILSELEAFTEKEQTELPFKD